MLPELVEIWTWALPLIPVGCGAIVAVLSTVWLWEKVPETLGWRIEYIVQVVFGKIVWTVLILCGVLVASFGVALLLVLVAAIGQLIMDILHVFGLFMDFP